MNDCYNWEMEEALIDMESNTDFIEKYMSDDIESFGHVLHEEDCLIRKSRENAWVRKRLHKKKMYRQFLSWNPRLDLSKVHGSRVMNASYIDYHGFDFDDLGTFVSYIDRYWFNPYSDVVLPEKLLKLTERIAKNVHDVFVKSRIEEGWVYGEFRDDIKKNKSNSSSV